MSRVEWGDNPPQAIDPNSLTNLPGFTEIVDRTRALVAQQFRFMRSDIQQIMPPIILCTEDSLNQAIEGANLFADREKNERGVSACYGSRENCIFYSMADLQSDWTQGETGRWLAAVRNAHEHLHAFTTIVTPRNEVRCGFVTYPTQRLEHGLTPGRFYQFTHPEVHLEFTDFREDPSVLRLNENTTDLVVNLMLHNLIPDLPKRYDHIVFVGDHEQAILQKTPDLIEPAIKAMYKDRKSLLEKPVIGASSLLPVLEDSHLLMSSITNPRYSGYTSFELCG